MGCTCNPGFSGEVSATSESPFYSSSCAAVGCPAGTTGSNVPAGCACDPGFSSEVSGQVSATSESPFFIGACDAVDCPSNSLGTDVPTGCTCDAAHDFIGNITASASSPFYEGRCTSINAAILMTAKNSGVLTCAELSALHGGHWGSAAASGDTEVCGESDQGFLNSGEGDQCYQDIDYRQALGICTSIGARLCSAEEMLADEAALSGCAHDRRMIWTSTECGGGHHLAAVGYSDWAQDRVDDGSCADAAACTACTADDDASRAVRCCADSQPERPTAATWPSSWCLGDSQDCADPCGLAHGWNNFALGWLGVECNEPSGSVQRIESWEMGFSNRGRQLTGDISGFSALTSSSWTSGTRVCSVTSRASRSCTP
eukprot:SAG22_NODE_3235_length_1841_cov_1.193456_1_plen_373_part_00